MFKNCILLAKAITTAMLVGALVVPLSVSAYLSPEDVLLNSDLYAPPRTRETEEAVRRQQRESELRREEQWDAEYEAQHPAPPEPVQAQNDYNYTLETDQGVLSIGVGDLELLRTIRLLERIDKNQEIIQHTGAPPLAPTGAGGILAAITMVGAVGWTICKAGKKKGWSSRTF